MGAIKSFRGNILDRATMHEGNFRGGGPIEDRNYITDSIKEARRLVEELISLRDHICKFSITSDYKGGKWCMTCGAFYE